MTNDDDDRGMKHTMSLGATVMLSNSSKPPNSDVSSEDYNTNPITISDLGSNNSIASESTSSYLKKNSEKPPGCSARWTSIVKAIHKPIMKFLQAISRLSAKNPKTTITFSVSISIMLLVIGLVTNFNLFVDEKKMWTPASAYSRVHRNWIIDESGFPTDPRYLVMFFHADGDNVLGKDQVSRVFEAVDTVRNMQDYDKVCSDSDYTTADGVPTCEIGGIPRFWNSSASTFEATVDSDMDAKVDMSRLKYSDGTPVVEDRIFGFPERYYGVLTSAKSYSVTITLPPTQLSTDFELEAIEQVLALDNQWATEDPSAGGNLRVEVQADGSFGQELIRAIQSDIPLVPVSFVLMSIFTCIVFFRKDRVKSRSLLGFGAVAAVLLSIMSGYGILFCVGIPFTSMTQLLPFIFFGIGLDDAFITMGSYTRTDQTKHPVDRIAETIDDVGLSITLTTITSATAFGLGCMSTIPAIYWFCLYTFPTIIFVLLYQLTFFVACIVIDEKRIENHRRDCCFCIKVEEVDSEAAQDVSDDDDDDDDTVEDKRDPQEQTMDRVMSWYAEKLLTRWVKVLVVIAFAFLVGFAAYSASLFKQAFLFTDVLPADSYFTDYVEAADEYTAASAGKAGIYVGVYFRNVDQSDPAVQEQMLNFVNNLVDMDSVEVPPDYFWLSHFRTFVNMTRIENLAFRDQIYLFLETPVFRNLFQGDIVLDSVGNIIESRTFIVMDNVDTEDVGQQINALEEQLAVTQAQPVNQGTEDFAFFTYATQYNMWEFLKVTPAELTMTTVAGIVAVTGVTVLLVPHWSAVFFIFPLICVLYVDLLGVMQWAGIHVNGVSYVSLIMSIGLLVDYIMHVLLCYYESSGNRREKTVETLRTMGASVLVGGISTFLGTLPLIFSTSNIFYTLFVAFLGVVTLGVSHGLILLPVILSTFGPEDQVTMSAKRKFSQETVKTSTGSSMSGDSSDGAYEIVYI